METGEQSRCSFSTSDNILIHIVIYRCRFNTHNMLGLIQHVQNTKVIEGIGLQAVWFSPQKPKANRKIQIYSQDSETNHREACGSQSEI